MKSFFQIFKKIVGLKNHNYLREIYLKFFDPLLIFFYRPSIIKKKIFLNLNSEIKLLRTPLILISQIQRSGGTLCSRLFDGHSQILTYPDELKISAPKWKWNKFNRIYTQYNSIGNFAKKKIYIKQDNAKWNKAYKFDFDVDRQRLLFNHFFKLNPRSDRHKLNSYFSSIYYSFKNYKHNGKLSEKKFIAAFCPRLNISKLSMDKFFKIYSDGFLITIIRHPKNWFPSAKLHAKKYSSEFKALKIWEKSTKASINLKRKNPDRVIIIHFEDLVKNPAKVMQNICRIINIKFERTLTKPTFNSKPILSNSSFKSKEGVIDKEVTKRSEIINFQYKQNIKKCVNLYEYSKKFKT